MRILVLTTACDPSRDCQFHLYDHFAQAPGNEVLVIAPQYADVSKGGVPASREERLGHLWISRLYRDIPEMWQETGKKLSAALFLARAFEPDIIWFWHENNFPLAQILSSQLPGKPPLVGYLEIPSKEIVEICREEKVPFLLSALLSDKYQEQAFTTADTCFLKMEVPVEVFDADSLRQERRVNRGIFCGRLDAWYKGADRFAEILPRLFDETPMENFLLISPGNQTALKIMDLYGRSYPIDFVNNLPRKELFREIARSFFAVATNNVEAPGSFPVECMALGTPVFSVSCSLGEVILDGKTGARSIESLNRLYYEPRHYRHVQKTARAYFKAWFSAASVGERCLRIFRGVLAGKAREVWERLRHKQGAIKPASATPFYLQNSPPAHVGPLRIGLQLPNINTHEGAVDGDEVMALGMANILSGLKEVEFAEVYDPVTIHDNLDVILNFYPFPLLRFVPGPRQYWWYQARVPEDWAANPEWRQLLCLYEGIFVASPELKKHLLSWGVPAEKISLLPMSCDRGTYYPRPEAAELDHEVVFCGNGGIRAPEEVQRYLTPLKDLGLAIFGSHWERFPQLRHCLKGPIPPVKVPELYSNAKIIISTHTAWHRGNDIPTSRLWEAMGCDGVVVSDRLPFAEKLFGDAVVWTDGYEDIREKVAYLLAHPEERARLKGKGRELIDRRLGFKHYMPRLVNIFRSRRMEDVLEIEPAEQAEVRQTRGETPAAPPEPKCPGPADCGPDPISSPREAKPSEFRPRKDGPKDLDLTMVVHALPFESLAGTEIYSYNLARELQSRGHRLSIISPAFDAVYPEGAVLEKMHQGLELIKINVGNRWSLNRQFKNRRVVAAFGNCLAKRTPDLVHFHHLLGVSAMAMEECARQRIPAVLTAHDGWLICEQCHFIGGDGNFCQGGPASVEKCVQCMVWRYPHLYSAEQLPRLIRSMTMRREYLPEAVKSVRTLLTPSHCLREMLRTHGIEHPQFLVSPLGQKPFSILPPQPPGEAVRFSFLGYMNYTKGLDILVRAFNLLASPKAQLDLHGGINGISEKKFGEIMGEVDPRVNVNYHGAYTPENLPEILSRTDVAVIASRFESYSLVTRECLHAGVPVIGPRVGGIPEVLEDGVNGLLFEPENHHDLADKLRFIMEHPEEIAGFRQRIRPVKTIAEDADEMESLYRRILASGTPLSRPAEKKVAAQLASAQRKDTSPGAGPRRPAATASGPPAVSASIIIPVFNNFALNRQCLESIWANTEPGGYEIIVVNNGSSDGTTELLRRYEEQGRLKAIYNRENLGFSKACNQGAEAAGGEFLVFLNNDTVVLPDWLRELLSCARKHGEIGAVGAKLLYPDESVQHAGVVFCAEKRPYHVYRDLHKDHPAVNKEREHQVVTGACMLVKRDVFFEAGLFDEQYQNGFEDVDLCFNIRKMGYKIIYNPRCVVYHLESKTPGRKNNERKNAIRFIRKWYNNIIHDDNYFYEQDGIYREVIQLGKRTIIYLHDDNDNHFWLNGRKLKKMEKYHEALEQYELAYRFNPYDPRKITIAEEMAALYEKLGRHDEAVFFYQTILAEFPSSSLELKLKGVLEKQRLLQETPGDLCSLHP
jgi:GT2 family glycosyltransferase/glycosyltransferase involved in cell wall biosynthesis